MHHLMMIFPWEMQPTRFTVFLGGMAKRWGERRRRETNLDQPEGHDEGHDVGRVFPDLNFGARKGSGLLNILSLALRQDESFEILGGCVL